MLTLQSQTVIRLFNVISWSGIRVKVRVEKCGVIIEVRVENCSVTLKVRVEKCSIASKVRVEKCSIASKVRVEKCDIVAKVRVEKCSIVAKVRVEKCIFPLFLCYKSILNYQRNLKSYAIWKENFHVALQRTGLDEEHSIICSGGELLTNVFGAHLEVIIIVMFT